jgi:DNA-binding transcriptional regulator GbsR (MarR family)
MSRRSSAPGRDSESILRFVERFALVITESGMARMPARVFTALLVTDSGRLTAQELADMLRVSPAAISGAVRYLEQVSMVYREREPGHRRDHYRVGNDLWYEMIMRRDRVLGRWVDSAREAVDLLGTDTPAGARMAETLEFFEFLHKEMPALMDKWRAHKENPKAR